jgi:NAD(P)-dependent dehydrogenase (short-subunit alcohol dehydrogenase family)
MTEQRFDGRVAVITGSGRGLGRSYAHLLAAKGAKVVVNDVGASLTGEGTDDGPAEDVAREIRELGGEAVATTESVATKEGGKAIIETALDNFGGIDILIHNAGNVRHGSLEDMPQEDFDAVIDVHLRGAFHVIRPAFTVMAKAKYGRIVLTGSIGGLYSLGKSLPYAVAKSGLIGMNNAVALEGAEKGIKSNMILPGAMTRMGGLLDTEKFPPCGPELVAPVVAYLSHESCSITGEMLVAIAGRVARAMVAESEGIYKPSWTSEEVAENLDAIRESENLWMLAPVPSGFSEHMGRSFEMARKGEAEA